MVLWVITIDGCSRFFYATAFSVAQNVLFDRAGAKKMGFPGQGKQCEGLNQVRIESVSLWIYTTRLADRAPVSQSIITLGFAVQLPGT